MDPLNTALFLAVIALGTYIQTVTGFAIGLIVIGGSALLHLLPIPTVAVIISLLGLVNNLGALHGRYREPDWKLTLAAAIGIIPAVPLGLWLLTTLDSEGPELLRRLLGMFIFASGVVLMLRPSTLARRSPLWAFTGVGALSGLFGGLFTAPGPPMVLFLYLQPLSIRCVQATMFSIFVIVTIGRLVLVVVRDEMGAPELFITALSLPVVMLFTLLGRSWPPPLGEQGMRRFAFALLLLIGLMLSLT